MPTNMTMSDLTMPALEAGNAGNKLGMEMGNQLNQAAQTYSNLQMQQAKQREMQNQLDTAHYNTITGTTNTAMEMSDPIFKISEKNMEKRLKQVNPDYQEGTLAAMRSDDNLKAGLAAYRKAVLSGEMPKDEAHMKLVTNAFGDPGKAEQLLNAFNEQRKMKSAHDLKEATLEVTKRGQDKRLEGQKMLGGVRLDAREADAVKGLADDPQVKPMQQNIMQAKKDYDLIQESRAKGLTPLKASELVQSYVGLLKGMSARSTGSEREELTHAAADLEQKYQGIKQRWLQHKGMIKYQDEPFLHDIEEGVRGLHGTLKDALQVQLNSKLRNSGLPSVNNAQQAAYNEMMQGAELGFKPRFKKVGQAPDNAAQEPVAQAPQQTQQQAPATLEQRASKAGFDINAARKDGKTDAWIDGILKKRDF